MKYTFQQFQSEYPDDDACLSVIFASKYGTAPVCPGCGVAEGKFSKITGRRAYACQDCGHHLYPCVGTPFEKSSTNLTKWFHSMYLLTATRNGVSAKELQRHLGVTYKCAWRIGHELRKLMGDAGSTTPLASHIEVNETYLGGKEKNKHNSKKLKAGRGTVGKTAVFGMLERDGALVVQDSKRARWSRSSLQMSNPELRLARMRHPCTSPFRLAAMCTDQSRMLPGNMWPASITRTVSKGFGCTSNAALSARTFRSRRSICRSMSMNLASATTCGKTLPGCLRR
ncbi:MAG: IS1595 family transposase [Nevskia sp.]|nr:IS1595 family transposase [Nevskia sp.]MCK9383899.1 IS1595 family transposase [Nevskia sp.]